MGKIYPIQYNFSDSEGFVSRYKNCSNGPQIGVSTTNPSCGMTNGSIVISVAGGGNTYQWNSGQTSSTIQSLNSGTYTVTVTNSDGCSSTLSVSLTSSPVVQANVNVVNAKCGLNNGSASAVYVSGANIQSYLWNTGSTTSTINNLQQGNYTVTITDVNNCTISRNGTVSQVPEPTYTVASQSTSCGLNNGSLTVTQTGGPQAISYQWSNGMTGPSVQSLQPGTYVVTVTDINNCTKTIVNTIAGSQAITLNVLPLNATCSQNNGSISISATGGNNYTYLWNTGQTSSIIQNLGSGVYTVTVTASNGCSKTATQTLTSTVAAQYDIVTSPAKCQQNNGAAQVVLISGPDITAVEWSSGNQNLPPATYNAKVFDANGCISQRDFIIAALPMPTYTIQPTHTTCGKNNGNIQINQTGGAPIGSFNWNNGNTGSTLNNLVAGTYSVLITDVNGCQITEFIVIEPSEAALITLSGTSTTCGLNNGSLCAVNAGSNPFSSIAWSNGTNTTCIFNLSSGTYNITATDILGCTASESATVAPSSAFIFSLGADINMPSSQLITLNAEAPGIVSYHWSTGDTTPYITVGAGDYNITVTNIDGCTAVDQITVNLVSSVDTDYELDQHLRIFPNPFSNIFQIEVGNLPIRNIKVYNAQGVIIFDDPTPLHISGSIFCVDLSEEPAGLYFVHYTGASSGFKPLVKVN